MKEKVKKECPLVISQESCACVPIPESNVYSQFYVKLERLDNLVIFVNFVRFKWCDSWNKFKPPT